MFNNVWRRVIALFIVLACSGVLAVFARRGEPITALVYAQYSFTFDARYYTYLDPLRLVSVRRFTPVHTTTLYTIPATSPNGQHVIEERRNPDGFRRLHVVDVESGTSNLLTILDSYFYQPIAEVMDGDLRFVLNALWSPSGEWLCLLVGGDRYQYGMYIVRPDGSDLRRVANDYTTAQQMDLRWVVLPA